MLLSTTSLFAILGALTTLGRVSALPQPPSTDGYLDFFDDENGEVCAGNQQAAAITIKDQNCIPLTPASTHMSVEWSTAFTRLSFYEDAHCGVETASLEGPAHPEIEAGHPASYTCADLSKAGKILSVKNTSGQ